ncbi:MAG: orotidine-5'-phosphate decarboxylase [Cardiobacteriaceae bacterium]|nr:orotidine-5'-phosphate decarboxylase [Cardiobacteriaceae bacterium]
MSHLTHCPLIIALDHHDPQEALQLAKQLNPKQCQLKIGKHLFTRAGHQLISALHQLNFRLFLDLKFHDIPNTVATAVHAAAELGVFMVNVHASGGVKMMQAAKQALAGFEHPPLLIGVTVLTSQNDEDLKEQGIVRTVAEQVLHLSALANRAGLDGVVCSAQEVRSIKALCGQQFMTVTPGIRPLWASSDDQKRIVTPKQALQDGADYLVVGRPITAADNPLQALERLSQEISLPL